MNVIKKKDEGDSGGDVKTEGFFLIVPSSCVLSYRVTNHALCCYRVTNHALCCYRLTNHVLYCYRLTNHVICCYRVTSHVPSYQGKARDS